MSLPAGLRTLTLQIADPMVGDSVSCYVFLTSDSAGKNNVEIGDITPVQISNGNLQTFRPTVNVFVNETGTYYTWVAVLINGTLKGFWAQPTIDVETAPINVNFGQVSYTKAPSYMFHIPISVSLPGATCEVQLVLVSSLPNNGNNEVAGTANYANQYIINPVTGQEYGIFVSTGSLQIVDNQQASNFPMNINPNFHIPAGTYYVLAWVWVNGNIVVNNSVIGTITFSSQQN